MKYILEHIWYLWERDFWKKTFQKICNEFQNSFF